MTRRILLTAFVVAATCAPAVAMGMASAELYGTKAYFYGRFDARIRYAPGDGVVSTFFLWKEGGEAANAYWGELDFEKIAADCRMQINNIYGNPETQHQSMPSMGIAMCEGYHDYRIEWTPTYIAWIVDGKEIRRDTGTNATTYTQNASDGMTFHFNIWPGNSSFGGNINNTKLPVHQYISWVQYSSYDNGNFKVEWREDFQSSSLPSDWAAGDWGSPFNLSTHNPKNVNFVDGIAVLSLTDDNATGNPGTPPADPSAGGSGGSGGSSGTGGTTSSAGGSGGGDGSGGTKSTTSSGGTSGSGGTTSSGGSSAAGGRTSSGGSSGSGGTSSGTSAGGTTSSGGSSASGGKSGTGGMSTSSGSAGGSGGDSSSGGGSGMGGTAASGGSSGSGGATASGGSSTTDTTGPTTNEGGCSCSTSPSASPPWSLLLVLLLVALRLRRKEI